MKVEILLYIYGIICISLIAFNCVYIFIIRHNAIMLERDTGEFDVLIWEQIMRLDEGLPVSDKHKKLLCRKLKSTARLTAFDKSLENIYGKSPEKAKQYLFGIYPVFMFLSAEYKKCDVIKSAYFPYIISKYKILKYKEISFISDFMFDMLHSDNVYCRENALKALYSTGISDYVTEALKIIDKNLSFHHPKLICDGLFEFDGDKKELADKLLAVFESYSEGMQVNIMNFIRFAGAKDEKTDEIMYDILTDESRNQELRFSAIRYFEKFPSDLACGTLQEFAENKEGRVWEYQAIASSALKAYPDEKSAQILKNNLSSSNWYVRLNSAVACERLGYSYADLIQVFDGNDRYAREMLQYRLDRREAEKHGKAVKKEAAMS